MKTGFVYIMTNKRHGTLYVGVIVCLVRRVHEHKLGIIKKCFTYRYGLNRLVYYEVNHTIAGANHREKQIKNWKIELIESMNPEWRDLPLSFE